MLLLVILLCGDKQVADASTGKSVSSSWGTHDDNASNDYHNVSPIQNNHVITPIFAESALMDKETGRIYWEGGSQSTLSESIEARLAKFGFHKATLLSAFLWIALYGWCSAWLRQRLRNSNWIQSQLQQNRLLWDVPLNLIQWTLLGIPRVKTWLLVTLILLYLLEAYFCSTHQFLSHRSDCANVESLMEELRRQDPKIHWILRTFHYEPWWNMTGLQNHLSKLLSHTRAQANNNVEGHTAIKLDPEHASMTFASNYSKVPSIFLRKRISYQTEETFRHVPGWCDQTTAGVWTRALGETTNAAVAAPLAKIHLTKMIILGDSRARQAYFQQQAQFVARYREQDDQAEFATAVDVAGYKPRVLVTRSSISEHPWRALLFSRRAFWLCTLLGLSIFYRAWMARHCDVIRVNLVKETTPAPENKSNFWWSSSSLSGSTIKRGKTDVRNGKQMFNDPKSVQNGSGTTSTTFRDLMQQLKVYRTPAEIKTAGNIDQPKQGEVVTNVTKMDVACNPGSSSVDETSETTSPVDATNRTMRVTESGAKMSMTMNVTRSFVGTNEITQVIRFDEGVNVNATKQKNQATDTKADGGALRIGNTPLHLLDTKEDRALEMTKQLNSTSQTISPTDKSNSAAPSFSSEQQTNPTDIAKEVDASAPTENEDKNSDST